VVGEVFGNDLLQAGRRWVEERVARTTGKAPVGVVAQVSLGKLGKLPFEGPFLALTVDVDRDLARAFLAAVEEALAARRGRFGLRRRGDILFDLRAPPLSVWAQLLTLGVVASVQRQVASVLASGASTGAMEIELRTEGAVFTLALGWPALVHEIDALFDPIGPEPLRGLGFPAFNPFYDMSPTARQSLLMMAAMSASVFMFGGLFR
jgi:hypothetical protein